MLCQQFSHPVPAKKPMLDENVGDSIVTGTAPQPNIARRMPLPGRVSRRAAMGRFPARSKNRGHSDESLREDDSADAHNGRRPIDTNQHAEHRDHSVTNRRPREPRRQLVRMTDLCGCAVLVICFIQFDAVTISKWLSSKHISPKATLPLMEISREDVTSTIVFPVHICGLGVLTKCQDAIVANYTATDDRGGVVEE